LRFAQISATYGLMHSPRRFPRRFALPTAAALALAACSPPPKIECPTAQMRGSDGVLKETPAEIATYGARFKEGYGGNAIPEAIAAVRQAWPAATDDEVRNFLVAAYCPVARDTNTGKEDQKEDLDQFETSLIANLTR
jgi:hypothetical protein